MAIAGFIDQWIFTTFPHQAWIQYDLFSAKVGKHASPFSLHGKHNPRLLERMLHDRFGM